MSRTAECAGTFEEHSSKARKFKVGVSCAGILLERIESENERKHHPL